ncbi:TPA: hypothetical protein QDA99_006621 [Burkholderia vietnamiensis]|uniref:hypothetical protein n=1 Tax=Burkholderia vietnamiensis TaxID=60552 RepID=UPI0015898C9D|nr:hypothetical protein [Burkholderia vietnamiensis]HDR9003017.1 hypothetical protein [Burkholderia vietnamiensis]HDR9006939.1 hypothetical protein [Burkholderia vietnamiensis]
MHTLTTITNERRTKDGAASDIAPEGAPGKVLSESEFIKLLSTLTEDERAATLAYIERAVRAKTIVTV